jgi:hypothetical protein
MVTKENQRFLLVYKVMNDIVLLTRLRGVLQFIGFDDGRDGWKGNRADGRRRGRYSGGRSAHCNFGALQYTIYY